MEETTPKVSIMSKKRYMEIQKTLEEHIADDATLNTVMASIRTIMRYDPDKSAYTPEIKQRQVEWRRRKAQELGVTTYVTSGMKAHYERSKATTNHLG